MDFSDELPPEIPEDVKRRNRKRRTALKTSREFEKLICTATKAARIAEDKGYHVVSPEAIRCVRALRKMRDLPWTPPVITKTGALRAVLFFATNGNPKIRSESRSLADHLRATLASGTS